MTKTQNFCQNSENIGQNSGFWKFKEYICGRKNEQHEFDRNLESENVRKNMPENDRKLKAENVPKKC